MKECIKVSAVGSFAGAPYLSAWSSALYEDTMELAAANLIDPVENIKDDKIFIFQGVNDTIVPLGKYFLVKMKNTKCLQIKKLRE